MNKGEKEAAMGAMIEVDGVVLEEVTRVGIARVPMVVCSLPSMAQREFHARMENWRRVVSGGVSGGAAANVCASWARWYVSLSEFLCGTGVMK